MAGKAASPILMSAPDFLNTSPIRSVMPVFSISPPKTIISETIAAREMVFPDIRASAAEHKNIFAGMQNRTAIKMLPAENIEVTDIFFLIPANMMTKTSKILQRAEKSLKFIVYAFIVRTVQSLLNIDKLKGKKKFLFCFLSSWHIL